MNVYVNHILTRSVMDAVQVSIDVNLFCRMLWYNGTSCAFHILVNYVTDHVDSLNTNWLGVHYLLKLHVAVSQFNTVNHIALHFADVLDSGLNVKVIAVLCTIL